MTDDSACVFCRIVDGTSPADEVWRDEIAVAFLDRSPVFKGHVLVVPTVHVVTLPELDATLVGPFFQRVQAIAGVVPAALDADGTFVANNNVVSQSVAHLHVHVVPRRRKDGLRGFFWPRVKYGDGEAAQYASALRASLQNR
ncbi:MAG: HIT family protein [Acidimicrobiales bacterium]